MNLNIHMTKTDTGVQNVNFFEMKLLKSVDVQDV